MELQQFLNAKTLGIALVLLLIISVVVRRWLSKRPERSEDDEEQRSGFMARLKSLVQRDQAVEVEEDEEEEPEPDYLFEARRADEAAQRTHENAVADRRVQEQRVGLLSDQLDQARSRRQSVADEYADDATNTVLLARFNSTEIEVAELEQELTDANKELTELKSAEASARGRLKKPREAFEAAKQRAAQEAEAAAQARADAEAESARQARAAAVKTPSPASTQESRVLVDFGPIKDRIMRLPNYGLAFGLALVALVVLGYLSRFAVIYFRNEISAYGAAAGIFLVLWPTVYVLFSQMRSRRPDSKRTTQLSFVLVRNTVLGLVLTAAVWAFQYNAVASQGYSNPTGDVLGLIVSSVLLGLFPVWPTIVAAKWLAGKPK